MSNFGIKRFMIHFVKKLQVIFVFPQGSPVDPNSKLNIGAGPGYGAVELIHPTNPFAYANPVTEEHVQPEATDSYMHGGDDLGKYQ